MVAGIFEKSRRLRKAFFLGIHFSNFIQGLAVGPPRLLTAMHVTVPQDLRPALVERLRTKHLRRTLRLRYNTATSVAFTAGEKAPLFPPRAQKHVRAHRDRIPRRRHLRFALPKLCFARQYRNAPLVVASRLLPVAEPRLD